MKLYEEIIVISDFDKRIFVKKLTEEIERLQNLNLGIEVQYSSHRVNTLESSTKYTALIMSYRDI